MEYYNLYIHFKYFKVSFPKQKQNEKTYIYIQRKLIAKS